MDLEAKISAEAAGARAKEEGSNKRLRRTTIAAAAVAGDDDVDDAKGTGAVDAAAAAAGGAKGDPPADGDSNDDGGDINPAAVVTATSAADSGVGGDGAIDRDGDSGDGGEEGENIFDRGVLEAMADEDSDVDSFFHAREFLERALERTERQIEDEERRENNDDDDDCRSDDTSFDGPWGEFAARVRMINCAVNESYQAKEVMGSHRTSCDDCGTTPNYGYYAVDQSAGVYYAPPSSARGAYRGVPTCCSDCRETGSGTSRRRRFGRS